MSTAPIVGGPRYRPARDTIPHHECERPWCGVPSLPGRANAFELVDWWVLPAVSRWFCSLGCVSRWAIREELRQP